MAQASELVNIVDFGDGDNGGLQLSLDALSKVLCQPAIENKPLVVIGIAGALRTGKSFLMSFLMRYLKNEGWKTPDWIGDEEKCADDGIEWRRGSKAHTKGIIIWNEVFTIEKTDKEFAILLLDTQGLFDDTMSKEENMKIFTFTVLMTSHLMLNIKSQIDERELESLEFFTEYAKSVSVDTENYSPFQNLLFLIRDWQYPDENEYGSGGGKEYLKEKLEQKVAKAELNTVRQNLRSTFQNLECFLMPHPGNNVTKRDFVGKNKDIDPEFLESVKQLAATLFDPNKLKLKSFNRKNLTGRELWTLLQSCNQTFISGQLPDVGNMVMAFTNMRNKIAVSESMKIFEETYEEEKNKTIDTPDKNHDDYFEKAQQVAIQYFESQTKFGGEDLRIQYRQHLISECQSQFHTYANWDDLRKIKAKNFSSQKRHEVWTKYRLSMKEDLGTSYKEPCELEEFHEKHKKVAIDSYRIETEKCASYHAEHEAMLIEDIMHSFSKFTNENEDLGILVYFGDLATKHQPDDDSSEDQQEYDAHNFFHFLSCQYREEFEKFYFLYIAEESLKQQLRKLWGSYFELFEEHFPKNGANIEGYRAKFMKLLDDEYKDCLEMNERNKILFESTIEESTTKMKAKYCETMHETLKDNYCAPDDLEKAHKEAKEKLTEDLKIELGEIDEQTRGDVLCKAQREISHEYETIRSRNNTLALRKPKIDFKAFLSKINISLKDVDTILPVIKRICATLATAKQTHNILKKSLPAVDTMTVSLSSMVIGGAVAVGVMTVVAYCVYKYYEEKEEKLMIKQ